MLERDLGTGGNGWESGNAKTVRQWDCAATAGRVSSIRDGASETLLVRASSRDYEASRAALRLRWQSDGMAGIFGEFNSVQKCQTVPECQRPRGPTSSQPPVRATTLVQAQLPGGGTARDPAYRLSSILWVCDPFCPSCAVCGLGLRTRTFSQWPPATRRDDMRPDAPAAQRERYKQD